MLEKKPGIKEEQFDAPLARYTTLKIGGEAKRLIQPLTVAELAAVVDELVKNNEQWFVLGGGSNLLVSSKGFAGTVVRTTQITSVERLESNLIEAGAGSRLPHLARHAAQWGLCGLEFAAGIPGTVGGGVIMNAGAHGSSMSEIVEEVSIYDSTLNKIVNLKKDDLGFQYRKCALDPQKHAVLSAKLRLNTDRPEEIEVRIRHNEEYRLRTQPIGFPNAGSTFKNPEPSRAAGMLLDQSGAKELKEGQAAVSALHANFVINLGGATSDQVTTLLHKMQDRVMEKFGVRLNPEWKTLGDFTAEEKAVWSP
ncbi:MAG TPA: UDP-N-acetylmuramate dehydrogenase [Candidatus Melainabacteria bacterium]|nr:UDP-N-acetylmuramate dehydrogenase [Candidatus Melainabacteria bacterium]